jgi:hypothetical protein
MARVTESTSIESPNSEWAGVAAGSKMLVGDSANPSPPMREELYTAASAARSEIRSPQRGQRRIARITKNLTIANLFCCDHNCSLKLAKRKRNYGLALFPQALDSKPHNIARLQIDRWLLSQTNSGRSSC